MARLNLIVQTVGRAGKDVGSGHDVLSADGAECANDGQTIIELANGNASARTVTLVTPGVVLDSPSLAVADQTFSVPGTSTRWIKLGPATFYNQSNGKVNIDVSGDGVTMTPINIAT